MYEFMNVGEEAVSDVLTTVLLSRHERLLLEENYLRKQYIKYNKQINA